MSGSSRIVDQKGVNYIAVSQADLADDVALSHVPFGSNRYWRDLETKAVKADLQNNEDMAKVKISDEMLRNDYVSVKRARADIERQKITTQKETSLKEQIQRNETYIQAAFMQLKSSKKSADEKSVALINQQQKHSVDNEVEVKVIDATPQIIDDYFGLAPIGDIDSALRLMEQFQGSSSARFEAIRLQILIQEFRYLCTRQSTLGDSKDPLHEEHAVGGWVARFEIGKKGIDVMDDIWWALRNQAQSFISMTENVFEAVTSFVTGGAAVIILAYEGYQGIKEWWEARNDPNMEHRDLHRRTGAITAALGIGGLGAASFLLACGIATLKGWELEGAVSASLGVAVMPVVIAGVLFSMYTLALVKLSLMLSDAKEKERQAELEYDNVNSQKNNDTLKNLADLIRYYGNKPSNNPIEQRELLEAQEQHAKLQAQIDASRNHRDFCRTERLNVEREVAFKAVEVTASTFVLLGSILGTASLVGASIATMGVLPMVLLLVGVGIGIASKYFEKKDKENEHKYTTALRNWFAAQYNYSPTAFKGNVLGMACLVAAGIAVSAISFGIVPLALLATGGAVMLGSWIWKKCFGSTPAPTPAPAAADPVVPAAPTASVAGLSSVPGLTPPTAALQSDATATVLSAAAGTPGVSGALSVGGPTATTAAAATAPAAAMVPTGALVVGAPVIASTTAQSVADNGAIAAGSATAVADNGPAAIAAPTPTAGRALAVNVGAALMSGVVFPPLTTVRTTSTAASGVTSPSPQPSPVIDRDATPESPEQNSSGSDPDSMNRTHSTVSLIAAAEDGEGDVSRTVTPPINVPPNSMKSTTAFIAGSLPGMGLSFSYHPPGEPNLSDATRGSVVPPERDSDLDDTHGVRPVLSRSLS